MWGIYEGMGVWIVLGMVCMVIFWAIIIGLVIWGIKQFTGDRRESRTSGETPLGIAQKRLVRGEISRDEFEELRKALE